MADSLKVEPSSRFRLTRNGVQLLSQHFAPAAATFTEYTADRLVLATNMTGLAAIDMGGVTTGEYVLLETDQSIKVAMNSTNANAKITVGKSLMVSGGAVTSLYVQNENTTYTANVQVVVVD